MTSAQKITGYYWQSEYGINNLLHYALSFLRSLELLQNTRLVNLFLVILFMLYVAVESLSFYRQYTFSAHGYSLKKIFK